MVEKLKQLLSIIEAKKGSVALFALAKMDEFTDKWTILLGASWVKDKEREVFSYVVDLIVANVDTKDLDTISRVGVYTPDEHLVEDLLKYKKNTHITEDVPANGNIIHEAYILQSRS